MMRVLFALWITMAAAISVHAGQGGSGSIDTVIDGQNYTCYTTGPVTCVPNCTLRSSDGRCMSYGSDFCEYRSACVPQCRLRQSDGRCGAYDTDYCGKDALCVPNCTLRKSDGSCGSYAADICSRH